MAQSDESFADYWRTIQDLAGVTSWKEIANRCSNDAEFEAPALESVIKSAEERLHVTFPTELRGLYAESNGIRMNYGCPVVMSVETMVDENVTMRTYPDFADLYMPFENLLIIGAEGSGDLFAYPIVKSGIVQDLNVLRWEHETDGRVYASNGVRDLLIRYGLHMI